MNYLKVVEKCKELTEMATFTTPEKLSEEIRKTGGTIFRLYNNPVGIPGDNLQKFDKIVDNIWLDKNESTYYLSRDTIKNYCIDVIQEIHINGENSTKSNNELKARWTELTKKEMNSYDVVFPLYGVIIDKVTKIGLFTAYNVDDYKLFVKSTISTEKIPKEPLFEDKANYLLLKIKARDSGRATELAKPYFELFEYISKFYINNSRNYDVGIFKYKNWKIEKALSFSKKELSASFSEKGAYEKINISKLTNSPAMVHIWEIMTKYIQGTTTKIENRLINAIRWVGMANSDDSNVTKHMQYVLALESLLSHRKKKEIITPGIAYQLAEFTAFIIGETANTEIIGKKELREKVFHEVKHIYNIRSEIAHGNDRNVDVHEIIRARKIVYTLILSILQNEDILKFNSMDKLDKWIENLKFSS